MIHLSCKIPNNIYLAISGGRDSMSILNFLIKGKKNVTLLYFNHGTEHGNEAQKFVEKIAEDNNLPIHIGHISDYSSSNKKSEEIWRKARYNFFKKFTDMPIITGHHLDDAIEWWIFTSIRGNPKLIPIQRDNPNIIRPFLFATKTELHKFCTGNFIQDPSNFDTKYSRNNIRHNLIGISKQINPGIEKTILKLYKESNKND